MTLQARAGQRAALRQVRTGLALAASVMVAIGAVATSAPLARAAGAETRVPLPATQDEPYIVGATGSAFVREDYDSATEEDDFSVSTDGGATWSVLTAPGFGEAWPRHFAAGKVTNAVPGESGDSTLVQRYDFASQGHSTLLEVPGAVDAIGTERVFYSAPRFAEEEPAVEYWTQAFEAAAQPVKLDYHPVATDFATSALRYGGGSRVVAVTRDESAPSEALVEVLPVDGSRSFTFRIAGYQDLDVQGDTAVYTLRSSTYLKVCFRSLDSASASPKCATVATGTRLSASVEANQAWTLVSVWKADYESLGQFMVTMGSTISIKKAVRPAGAESFWLTTAGDLARPLASVVTTDGGYMGTYLATGKVEGLFDYPDTTARIEQLQLTGGAVSGLDNRPVNQLSGYQPWSRSVAGGVIGADTLLAPRASALSVSGARTWLTGRSGTFLLDQGQHVRQLPSAAEAYLSGPYYLAYGETSNAVYRVDGKKLASGSYIEEIFGSQVFTATGPDTYRVTDVAGRVAPFDIDLPGDYEEGAYILGVYNDYLLYASLDSDDVAMYNYRTGVSDQYPVRQVPGEPVDLGDGYVVVWQEGEEDSSLGLWRYADGSLTTLVADSDELEQFTTDRAHRYAYATGSELVLGDLGITTGMNAPRMLGVLAPTVLNTRVTSATWKPEIDATKALGAGTLNIFPDGLPTLVRTIAVAPTADGSIRDVAWNGRDDAGNLVPPGKYRWEFTAPAADGSGSIRHIDGSLDGGTNGEPGVAGTVEVIDKSLGNVYAVTPKVSDTTPVFDQELKAVPGAWTPAGQVTFTYQWSRVDAKGRVTPIDGATGQAYKVVAADLGQRLKVTVTGAADGWVTKVLNSAVTSIIAKAPLVARVPLVAGTAKVGETLHATTEAWGPDPVEVSFAWYKVSPYGTSTKVGTGPDHTIAGTEAGYRIKVKATGSKFGYADKSVYSKLTTTVAKADFPVKPAPSLPVAGTPRVGKELTAVPGAHEPAANYSYQWYRVSASGRAYAIYGKTKQRYTLAAADLGYTVKAKVTASLTGYRSDVQYTPATAVVQKGISGVTPKISDTTPVVDQELSVLPTTDGSKWGPADASVDVGFTWYAGASEVGTGTSYVVRAADVGKAITVKAVGTAADYPAVLKSSSATARVVKAVFATKGAVTVTEEAGVLTAHSTDWTPLQAELDHQWYLNGVAVPGATDETWTAVKAGKYKVKVIARKPGYTDSYAYSAELTVTA